MRFHTGWVAALGLIAVGVAAVRDPGNSAKQFGLPLRDKAGLGFVRGCGTRDIALGLMILSCKDQTRRALVILGGLALADALTVSSTSDDPPPSSLGLHMLGFGGALLLAALSRKPKPAAG